MLKNQAKDLLSAIPNADVLPRWVHKTIFKNRLVIVMYHMIVPAPFSFPDWCIVDLSSFRKQLLYLSAHFDLLPLSEAVEKCLQGKLRRLTAAVTFDDGYQNNFDTAFPLLKELNIPATLFLTTGLMDTEDTLWFCRINEALANYDKGEFFWRGNRFNLGTSAAKAKASRSLQISMKQLSPQALSEEVRRIVEDLGDDPMRPIGAQSPYRMLDTRSIKEMLNSGLISLGAHSNSHSILGLLPKKEQLARIAGSLDFVKNITGEPCKVFAYPNGKKQDYTDETVALLRRCGVRLALTTIAGNNRPATSPLELRRTGIGGDWKMGYFRVAVHPGLRW